MKKLSIILFLCAMISTSFAQLTLVHTFQSCDWLDIRGDLNLLGEPINRYVIRNGNSVQIYKPDFSLEKTVNVNLPSGYTLSSVSVSQHLYNTDNSYEFIVTATNPDVFSNQQYNNYYYLAIVNENGSILEDFGYAYTIMGGYNRIAGQLRFYVMKEMYSTNSTDTQYTVEIYSCSGNYSGVAPIESHNQLSPYPNPATSIINLPYELAQGTTAEMRIFNSNGQVVEVKQLGSHFNNILLNVDNYVPGIYFYEYNGNRGKFIVQ